jgi:hypothetical protein
VFLAGEDFLQVAATPSARHSWEKTLKKEKNGGYLLANIVKTTNVKETDEPQDHYSSRNKLHQSESR